MAALCKDGCFNIMASKLAAVENAERACRNKGESTGSGNDENAQQAEQGTEMMTDMFTLGCTENEKGENCMDKMMALPLPDAGADESQIQEMVCRDVAAVGCCFGTMLAQVAWGLDDEEDAAQMDEMTDFASMVSECPGGEAASPCTSGSLQDVTVVKSEVTFEMDYEALNVDQKKATRKSITQGIATDLDVNPKQVVITKITVKQAAARRQLSGTTTEVDYQVTLNPDTTTDNNVKSKIEGGNIQAESITDAAAANGASELAGLSASQVSASQQAQEAKFEAETPTGSSAESATSSGMGTGALVGVIAGALVGVALIAMVSMIAIKRSKKPAATANNGAGAMVTSNDEGNTGTL